MISAIVLTALAGLFWWSPVRIAITARRKRDQTEDISATTVGAFIVGAFLATTFSVLAAAQWDSWIETERTCDAAPADSAVIPDGVE